MIGHANVKQFMTMTEEFQLNYCSFDPASAYLSIAKNIFERTPDENLLLEITIEEYE